MQTVPSTDCGFDVSQHPCFRSEAKHKYGRIHLPVAPRCNVQCNFCNRRYDCLNERRPGVTSAILNPQQANAYLDEMLRRRPDITVLGIAGPGNPFAATVGFPWVKAVSDLFVLGPGKTTPGGNITPPALIMGFTVRLSTLPRTHLSTLHSTITTFRL